ncbi:MAG: response regulator transcription factor, partial [Acidimicrobiia bacterium]|nr:response regulator transcription factor [Acidimicrobiia bacterium]
GVMSRPRVFLVEDEHLTRVGTKAILAPDFDIVGEADNVTDAVEMIRERKPDLVVLDIRIREGSGVDVLKQVRSTDPDIVFLAVTISTSRKDVARLFREGVDGYLTKQAIGPDLPDLVTQALRGERPISRQVAGYLLDIDDDVADDAGIARLTPREREVVVLIARGFTYRETAAELGMAVKTLENHIHSIFEKLGIASRHELSALAYGTGFVAPEP